jgi:uncharacterized membrane protein (DUF485 family)
VAFENLARVCLFESFRVREAAFFLCRMTPIFFAELPEYRSLMSFAARLRGTPKASAVSIGVGNREVILIAMVLNSSYIFDWIIPI